MTHNHTIAIKQKIEEKLSRDLTLITGTIESPCDHEYVELIDHKNTLSKHKLHNGNFKALVRLTRDSRNRLKINYCESEVEIILQHESTDPLLYDVQPLYIIPKNHNGNFQSEEDIENNADRACSKIDLLMKLAQCVISSKIYEAEQIECSFAAQKCQVFYSDMDVEDVWTMSQWNLYDKIAEELLSMFGTDIIETRKFVGFMSCTKFLGLDNDEDYSYMNIKNKTLANPSLGTGFLALLGNGCFFALPDDVTQVSESFENKKIVDVSKLLDESNYRKTYGGCFSTFLGSLIHEMGHTFDLAHTSTGIMGTDIDYVHRFFLCQNFTEVMPKRIISNCQQVEKTTNVPINRVTKIKKNGIYMEKYHEQKNKDLTNFETNGLLTLMSHKWFTQNKNRTDDFISCENRTVESTNSNIVLVEVRESEEKNCLVKKFWDLRHEKLRKFEIPSEEVLEKVTLFAINSNGCILKKSF